MINKQKGGRELDKEQAEHRGCLFNSVLLQQ